MKAQEFKNLSIEVRNEIEKNAIVLFYKCEVNYQKDRKDNYENIEDDPFAEVAMIYTTEDYYALRDKLKYHYQKANSLGRVSDGKKERREIIEKSFKQCPELKTIDYYVLFQKVAQNFLIESVPNQTKVGYLNELLKTVGGQIPDQDGKLVDRIHFEHLHYPPISKGNVRNAGNKYELLHELIYCERGWPVKEFLKMLAMIGITNKDLLQVTRMLMPSPTIAKTSNVVSYNKQLTLLKKA